MGLVSCLERELVESVLGEQVLKRVVQILEGAVSNFVAGLTVDFADDRYVVVLFSCVERAS